jgi:O-antigen ligase
MVARLRTSPVPPALLAAAAAAALVVGAVSGPKPVYGLALALGLVFVVVVVGDLMLGLYALVLFSFLETLSQFGGLSVAKAVGLVLAVSWLAVIGGGQRGVRNLLNERPGLTYLLILFLGWTAISLIWSPVQADARTSVMRYALNAVLIPIAFTAVRDRRDVTRLLAVVVAGAAIAAISGIVSAPGSGADAARATGTVGDANELAASLVIGITVAGAFAVNRHIAPPWRLLSLAAAGLCLLGILLSLSRGGLLGLAAAVVAAIVVAGRWRPQVTAGALAVVVMAVGYFAFFASLPAKERVTNVGGGTGRVDLWTVGWRMVQDHPVRGVGTGQFQTSSVHYLLQPGAIQRGDFILSQPKVAHNTYLNVLSELGVIGTALFAGVVLFSVGCLFLAARQLRADGDERLEILVRGLLAGVGGYLVTLMFISENYAKLFWVVLALGPALLAVARARRPDQAPARPPAAAPPPPRVVVPA